jgi:hypothetical protein
LPGLFSRFKRTERVDALIIEDNGTYIHYERLEKDNDIIWDNYYGNCYLVPAPIKPITARIGRSKRFTYLLWKDSGVGVGLTPPVNDVVHAETSPDQCFDTLDKVALSQTIAKNPATFRVMTYAMFGLALGTFVFARFI